MDSMFAYIVTINRPKWILGMCLYIQCWNCDVFGFHMGLGSGMRSIRTTPAPEFFHTPLNVTYHTGELAVLYCTIYNLGTKTVVWRRTDNQGPITIGEMTYIPDDRFLVNHVAYKDQWNLLIKNVQPVDEGTYECQVSSTDRTIRRLITLNVEDWRNRSTHIQISGPEFVEKGENVIFTCNATGNNYPPDDMDWFRNGQKVFSDIDSGVQIYKRVSASSKTMTSILKIERAAMEDDGTYVCRSSDLQITSKKLNVLNAGTSNVKRGTDIGKMSQSMFSSSDSSSRLFQKRAVIFVMAAAAFCQIS